jgi:hypothetical protein
MDPIARQVAKQVGKTLAICGHVTARIVVGA